MAGESAEQLAQRQRAKAERLLKVAELYERGAQGERTTGAILDGLRDEGWAVFHDVRWPGRPRANIDHVVVGPPGVFVVDSKNWSGRIDVRDNTFWCGGRRHDQAVASAGEAALAVARLVSAPATPSVRSVLAFVRDAPVSGWCYDVMLCSTANLREMLLSRPVVLTPEQVRQAGIELDIHFRSATEQPGRVQTPAPQSAPRWTPPSVRVAAPARTRTRAKNQRGASLIGGLMGLLLVAAAALIGLSQLPRIADFAGQTITNHLVAKQYDSCRKLRGDYPYGVGTTEAVAKVKRKQQRPDPNSAVYLANSKLDRDSDGLACEPKR